MAGAQIQQVPHVINHSAWNVIQQMASVDPNRHGDNKATSCSVVFFNRSNGSCKLYVHRRSANIKHGLTLSSAGGIASFNKSWSDSMARETLEEVGINISGMMSSTIMLTNYKGAHHHHVSVALEIPSNVAISKPSHAHELDSSFGNSINHHDWVDIKSLMSGKHGKVHDHYAKSVTNLCKILGI